MARTAALTRTRVKLGPMTRVGGGLAVTAEHDQDQITDAHVAGTRFRGYENIIIGRDARDTLPFLSRICGWCGGVHMTTASLGLEMAWGIQAPPMATALRSIAQATEAIWIHAAHLAVRAGPDYCAPVVAATTPRIWEMAQRTSARGAATHGFGSIAELMEGLTPVTGRYWRDTIPQGRRVMEMISLLYGKFPHPSVLNPASVGSTLAWGNFTEYYSRLYLAVDYVKQVCAIWDDLVDFLYEADDRFMSLGERSVSFIHAGAWDNERSTYAYDNLDEIGATRLCRPGVMVNGQLVTDNLSEVHRGIEEHFDHSFLDVTSDRSSAPADLGAFHPWFNRLEARPRKADLDGAYSWSGAPRWRGEVLETTPLGRLWLTAALNQFPANDFIETTGTGIRILVPMNFQPETVVEWKIPQRMNTLERLRADAYGIAFSGLCAAIALLKGFELTRSGEMTASHPWDVPNGATMGVGLWESGRGMNVHWVHTDKGRIKGYQVVSASTWNASPRDGNGRPGPIEEALIGSPIIEEPADGRLSGIDAARVVRSFDPCMNCGSQ